MSEPLVISDTITIPGRDLTWVAVRASGPGGQNVNKVASKIELRFDLAGTSAVDSDVKARLYALARTKLDAEDKIVLTSQKTRDQARNLADAREKLAILVQKALERPVVRKKTKPTRGSQRRRVDDKRHSARQREERRNRD
jgi:ribosome-associated protein